jgi:hypothetical protein
MNGSGTNYSLSNSLNTAGMRTFRTGVYDNYGSLKGSEMTGTFEVTKPNTPPTLSIISGADTATAGSAYTLQLQANDVDGNLSNIQITNWGDGASNYQNATNNSTLSFTHTFNSAGSYTISATAYDIANATSTPVSKSVSVSQPVVVTPPAPVLSTTGYTKIAKNGSVLSDSAQLGTAPTDWACTKDNKTGLIWEVKTTDGGLRDKDWYYSWYEPDASKNGGFTGYQNGNGHPEWCKGSNCDTYAFTNAVNAQGLCGASDWSMPTSEELRGLVFCSDGKTKTLKKEEYSYICTGSPTAPTINTTYFPNTQSNWFWSSSSYASSSDSAWSVGFDIGGSGYGYKDYSGDYVRLVR